MKLRFVSTTPFDGRGVSSPWGRMYSVSALSCQWLFLLDTELCVRKRDEDEDEKKCRLRSSRMWVVDEYGHMAIYWGRKDSMWQKRMVYQCTVVSKYRVMYLRIEKQPRHMPMMVVVMVGLHHYSYIWG